MAVQKQKQKQSVVLPSSYSYSPPSPLSGLFLSPFSSETSFLAAGCCLLPQFIARFLSIISLSSSSNSNGEKWRDGTIPVVHHSLILFVAVVLRSRVACVRVTNHPRIVIRPLSRQLTTTNRRCHYLHPTDPSCYSWNGMQQQQRQQQQHAT